MIELLGFYILATSQIFSIAAYAAMPNYTTASAEILGQYRGTPGASRAEAIVKKGNGGAVLVHFSDENITVELESGPAGTLKFSTVELDGECDNPGCSVVRKVSGTVFAKKTRNMYQPVMKVTIATEYPFPESEGDLEGIVEETRLLVNAR